MKANSKKLNARAVGHRIENLSNAGSYRVHNTKTGEYHIVTKNAELQQLISNLEKEHDSR